MVVTDRPASMPLRGSSFGGSRAQKPRIVTQFREKLSAAKRRQQGQLAVSSSSGSSSASGDADDDEGPPSPVSSATKSPAPERRRSSTKLAAEPSKSSDMLKLSAIHQSPRKPTLGIIGSRRKKTTTNALSPKYFEAGEYEYELSLQAAPSLGQSDDGSVKDMQEKADAQPLSGIVSVKSLDEETTAAYCSASNQFSPSPPRPPSSCSLSRSKSADSTSASSIPFDAKLQDSIVVTTRPIPHLPVRKTIYLIRHAESDENRRQQSLYKSISKVRKLTLPTKADLAASLELVDVNAQVDSDVSEVGERQIARVGDQLRAADFVVKEGIELVVHSPLRRARQTSAGMLGCVAPKDDAVFDGQKAGPPIEAASCNGDMRRNTSIGAGLGSLLNPLPPDPTASGMAVPSVSRIVELPELSERTPLEWLPVNHDAFTNRIASFEKWLAEQPERKIAVVGHSHYFQCMLGLNYKFRNCDVWRVTYDSSVGLWTSPEEVKQTVRKDYWRQKEDKRREKSERVLKDLEKRKEKIQKDIEETRDRVKEDWERLLRQMTIDGYKDDGDFDGDGEQSSTEEVEATQNASVEEAKDNQATAKASVMGELEKEHLPRGWSGLQRLYTYNN
mmetsp:Transcript_26502/g.76497  ORF Transcript_26502/g.76497 Transcript_26502/m.76497 type:complete len:617 (+) Transcript_26502:272-2122(+)